MKTRLTILLLFLAMLAHAQYDYYFDGEPTFGMGIGYNFTSMVGDDVRPIEVSFRYRINSDHMLQLYVPFLYRDDSFKSQEHPDLELIDTSLDSKKRLYGVGIDYDYALQSFSALDFVIGLRAEYQLYKYRTNLTNNYMRADKSMGASLYGTELEYRNKNTRNFIVSPNVGARVLLNRFAVDAKFLLSMISTRGDIDNRIESSKSTEFGKGSIDGERTDKISNKFKLKPAVMVSMSYFF